MSIKRCGTCKAEKLLSEYHKNRSQKDGLQNVCKDCGHKHRSVYKMNNLRKGRNYEAVQKYKLKPEDYSKMLNQQNGVCWICKSNSPGNTHKFFSIDHCHTTGMIRGLLCNRCNHGLGNFKDQINLLKVAIDYLNTFHRG